MKIYLQSPAPNYTQSCNFYRELGFEQRYNQDQLAVFSDSNMHLLVNGRNTARLGYVIFASDFASLRKTLGLSLDLYTIDDGFVTSDPNGVRLYMFPLSQHPEFDETLGERKNHCGTSFGTGIETTRFDESVAFWSLLGYQTKTPIDSNTQYATLTHSSGPAITFYKPGNCPHAFYNPSLTYFNGKEGNPIVIEKLRKLNVRIVEEISIFNEKGEVDNIIISDPGGLHSFIYNDG